MIKCEHCERYETPIPANMRTHLAARHPEAFAALLAAEAETAQAHLKLAQEQSAIPEPAIVVEKRTDKSARKSKT